MVPRKTVKDSLVGEEDEEWAWHPKSQSFFDRGDSLLVLEQTPLSTYVFNGEEGLESDQEPLLHNL